MERDDGYIGIFVIERERGFDLKTTSSCFFDSVDMTSLPEQSMKGPHGVVDVSRTLEPAR